MNGLLTDTMDDVTAGVFVGVTLLGIDCGSFWSKLVLT
jgi:hypothetical protein